MIDREPIEEFRDYRVTFLGSVQGQRVLADLIQNFSYNTIQIPMANLDMAKLDGARDVIRYILGKLGFDQASVFVKALMVAHVTAPEPMDTQITAEE